MIRPLTPELQKVAIEELNEDPKRVKEDILHIKEWLIKQQHIKARTDDQWILNFLRGCKFSLERTKEKLDMFYTCRTIAPEFFRNRDPFDPEIQEILKLGIALPLPKTKGPDTPRVLLYRSMAYDPNKISVDTMMKVNGMIADILINEDDQHVVCGFIGLQDMANVSMVHLTAMTPALARKAMTIFQDAMPSRPKAMHHFNVPPFFETVYNMAKGLLTEKLRARLTVHRGNNMEGIYDTVPKSILPKEYGGDDGSCDELIEYWKKKIESYRDWFIEDENYKTDESKRPGKPKTSDTVFGIEGSFRKLNVD